MTKLKKLLYCLYASAGITLFSFIQDRPALYLVGDSTVEGGWGKFMHQYLDTTKIRIVNSAISGTSTRTFYTGGVHEKNLSRFGLWEGVLKNLKRGDVVMMQFGHNDGGPLADSARSRGSMRGTGDDTTTIYNRFLERKETVHTYGWYLNRMVTEAKSKGAVVVVCSPIPMDKWKDGKVIRATESYVKWSNDKPKKTMPFFWI